MAHVKILPSQCPAHPGDVRESISLYLYDTLGDLLTLSGLDVTHEDFTTWRVGMDLQQFWGFADITNGHIHAWIGAGLNAMDAMHFFAHELSHILLDDVDLDDETRADTVGWITRQAFSWTKQTSLRKGAAKNGDL